MHQPDPGQDLNNPVAQPVSVPDDVAELPGDTGIGEKSSSLTEKINSEQETT